MNKTAHVDMGEKVITKSCSNKMFTMMQSYSWYWETYQ